MIKVAFLQAVQIREHIADATIGKVLALPWAEIFGQPLPKLFIKGAHQCADAVNPNLRVRELVATHQSDRAAYAIALQDPVEALFRIGAVMKGDLDDLLRFLSFWK